VIASLVAVELYYGDWRSALVPLGMSIAFVILAPWSWQVLRGTLAGIAVYVAGAVAVVAAFGIALPRAIDLGPTFLTDAGSLAIAGVLYSVGGWGLGRDIELEQDLEDVRLKAIRAHLDPHFLYNTLNAIAEWCAEDPKVAEEATIRLADMLRAILEGLEQRRWPLARELVLVEDLLELHRLRDADAFTTRIDAGDASGEIPPLVLVSLVENAIKHGPRAGHRGEIAVRVTRDRGLRCEVTNPGAFAPHGNSGRGLAQLRKRLALDGGQLSIAADGNRTRAALELP
ncbi:MAG: histidine kinase, partial [Deltaproteobacteria bacterium]|nr:histidine kinase [Deltaproteobacteria bacterium]